MSRNDTRGLKANPEPGLGANGTSTINRVTQSIDDTAEKLITNRNIDNGSGTFDNITFLDEFIVT